MKGNELTLAGAVEMGFHAANYGIKPAIFRSIKMALTGIEHDGLMDNRIRNSFECWTQSEVFVNRLT